MNFVAFARRGLRPGLHRLAAALLFSAGAAGASTMAQPFEERVDNLVRMGEDTPDAALTALAALGQDNNAIHRRAVLLAEGIVAARNGRDVEAGRRIDALLTLWQPVDALAQADSHLVRAVLEDTAGHTESAYTEARAALQGFDRWCQPGQAQRDDCDYRAWWRALGLAESGAVGQGNSVVAASHAQAMLDVARRFEDRPREAISLAYNATLAEINGDPSAANRLIAQAQRLGRADGTPWLMVRLGELDGMLHHYRQQPELMQRDYEDALVVATDAGLNRDAMRLRANLSDAYIRQGRSADALKMIALALPVARQHRDLRLERLLLHNATLAQLALGHVSEAKAGLNHVLELWQRDTGPGQRDEALREFGEALAKAGDVAGALQLFHQEDALAKEIRETNTSAAEAEMRAKYDQVTQKRRIELMARDNELTRTLLRAAGVPVPDGRPVTDAADAWAAAEEAGLPALVKPDRKSVV